MVEYHIREASAKNNSGAGRFRRQIGQPAASGPFRTTVSVVRQPSLDPVFSSVGIVSAIGGQWYGDSHIRLDLYAQQNYRG